TPPPGGSSPRQRTVVPGRGPASTARAAGAATAPLPRPGSRVEVAEELPPAGPAGSSVGIVVSHRRTALYVALGVLAGVLAAGGGATAAYSAIKSAGEPSAAAPGPDRPRAEAPPPPAQARQSVDRVRTVELAARSVTGQNLISPNPDRPAAEPDGELAKTLG